ncbi:outer membrane beta-barrel protein [Myxococcota bacterium]|nr:outer membrane beta-barrel protein [Myxococcota bacterium]
MTRVISVLIMIIVVLLPAFSLAAPQDITLPPDDSETNAPPRVEKNYPRRLSTATTDTENPSSVQPGAASPGSSQPPGLGNRFMDGRTGFLEGAMGFGKPQFDGDKGYALTFSVSLLFFPTPAWGVGLFGSMDLVNETYKDEWGNDVDLSLSSFSAGLECRYYFWRSDVIGLWVGGVLGSSSIDTEVQEDWDPYTSSDRAFFLSLGVGASFSVGDSLMGIALRYRHTMWSPERFSANFITLELAYGLPF